MLESKRNQIFSENGTAAPVKADSYRQMQHKVRSAQTGHKSTALFDHTYLGEGEQGEKTWPCVLDHKSEVSAQFCHNWRMTSRETGSTQAGKEVPGDRGLLLTTIEELLPRGTPWHTNLHSLKV